MSYKPVFINHYAFGLKRIGRKTESSNGVFGIGERIVCIAYGNICIVL